MKKIKMSELNIQVDYRIDDENLKIKFKIYVICNDLIDETDIILPSVLCYVIPIIKRYNIDSYYEIHIVNTDNHITYTKYFNNFQDLYATSHDALELYKSIIF